MPKAKTGFLRQADTDVECIKMVLHRILKPSIDYRNLLVFIQINESCPQQRLGFPPDHYTISIDSLGWDR
jgi:hypothetical protein